MPGRHWCRIGYPAAHALRGNPTLAANAGKLSKVVRPDQMQRKLEASHTGSDGDCVSTACSGQDWLMPAPGCS